MIPHIKSVTGVLIGAIMLLLITLVNGQPFFFSDTSNYVRTIDAGVVWMLGTRFATPWTSADVIKTFGSGPHDPSRNGGSSTIDPAVPVSGQTTLPNAQNRHTNSLEDGVILYGRSAYYGALLYLGEISGGFWLSVFIQALVVSYLVFILTVRCFALPVSMFLLSIAFLTFFSTAPFFVGFLMPYIFAGATIMVTGIFIVFWDNIRPLERFVLAIILAFSVLSHLTHLLICISMLLAYGIASISYKFRIAHFRLASIATVTACVLAGIFGEIAFGVVVTKATGISPIRPPVIMARLINLGPGFQYLKADCGATSFAVCQFRAKLPLDTNVFMWSPDPAVGVFGSANKETKRALGDEQFSFAMRVFAFDPVGVIFAVLQASAHQLITFGLNEFRNDGSWNNFADLPVQYWSKMQGTIAFKDGWLVDIISEMDYAIVILSCLILIATVGYFTNHRMVRTGVAWTSQILFCVMIGVGVIVNAIICGSFSTIDNHYQARVIWLIPLLAVLVVSRCCTSRKMAVRT